MARNRKSQPAALRFGAALKATVLCLLIAGSGVGYVWQKDQIVRLGHQMGTQERALLKQQQDNEQLRKQLAGMRSLPFLERRIKELNLGLMPAQPGQIVRLPEPQTEAPAPRAEPAAAAPQLAARAARPPGVPDR